MYEGNHLFEKNIYIFNIKKKKIKKKLKKNFLKIFFFFKKKKKKKKKKNGGFLVKIHSYYTIWDAENINFFRFIR